MMEINHNGFYGVNVGKENVCERNFVQRCIQEMIRNFRSEYHDYSLFSVSNLSSVGPLSFGFKI